MVFTNRHLSKPLWNIDTLWNAINNISSVWCQCIFNFLLRGKRIFIFSWSKISSHYKSRSIGTNIGCKPMICLNVNNLWIEHTHYNTWIFHYWFPLIVAFFKLLHSDKLKINGPICVKLILPLLKKGLKHQDLFVSNVSLRVNLSQFSVSNISVSLLRLRLCIINLVEFRKVFL